MDYSAAIADDPAAASPWGSSSPRAQRTPFTGAVPDSPTTPSRSETADSQAHLPEPALEPPETPTREDISNDTQPPVSTAAAQVVSNLPQDTQIAQTQQSSTQQQAVQQKSGAARYHNPRPRQVPQYKLQAKVTALERTGRKDPVIRFDVYV